MSQKEETKSTLEEIKEKIVPKLQAEEEEDDDEDEEDDPVDPAVEIKEKCAENNCASYKARLDECNERVKSKSNTTETCMEEIMDFYHCVDHCAAPEIFKHLK